MLLCCEDFVPSLLAGGRRPKLAPFSDSVGQANRWLGEHPEVLVHRCETLRAAVSPQHGEYCDTQVMSYPAGKPKDVSRFSLRGLRIWYQKQPEQEKHPSKPSQITSIDVLPRDHGDKVETFQHVLTRLNGLIAERKGQQLLNIETLTIPGDKKEMDCEETVLPILTPTKLVRFLRAYLISVEGSPLPPEVHFQDFLPQQVAIGKVSTFSTKLPTFEPLSETFTKANKWLQAYPDVNLVNVQVFEVLLDKEASYCASDPQTCFFSAKKPPFGWLKVVRIYYNVEQGSASVGKLVDLSFCPEVKEKKTLLHYAQYEELAEVVKKVQLKCESVGGVPAGVQSVWTYPDWESGQDVFQPNTSLHLEPRLDGTEHLPQVETIQVCMIVK
ncbi:PREDICTED: uncharacterized protein LOC109475572 [Branchiostoma belcheri]|uniref:Uncharacterized protein LOC109475572 n=1 Tax=Branchiostoma belcheri TaxID=7741 RepID=A0A6P4ZL96_BRABE|nr:PREDICTED: uncharacterized protein LOC109475572 [Branchiostoma belcheri]